MKRADSEEAFFATPFGQYLVAPGLAYWCRSERLWGVTICGTADESTVERLMRWMDAEHERDYGTYRAVFDLRDVQAISPRAFAEFAAFNYRNRDRQARRVDRGAVVRPATGMYAAAIEGAVALFRPSARWEVVDSIPRGLALLDERDPEGEIDALRRALAEVEGTCEQLHAIWAREPDVTAPDALARRLGLSVRSMQRRLRDRGTCFEQELRRARIRRAQRLLAETDLKLAGVALDAGFATPAHFSRAFREETGETPSAWRERVRNAARAARSHR